MKPGVFYTRNDKLLGWIVESTEEIFYGFKSEDLAKQYAAKFNKQLATPITTKKHR